MSIQKVFVGRLAGCGVFDPVGDKVGRVRDVVVIYREKLSPRVVGLVVEIPGRRRVFVSISKVTSIGSGQIITTGLINVRKFEQRGGEVRVLAEIIGRKVTKTEDNTNNIIEDIAIELDKDNTWKISEVFLRQEKQNLIALAKAKTSFANWEEITENKLPGTNQSAEQLLASYTDLKPADLANILLDLPEERMFQVASELPDRRLADVLEEMPESDQLKILASFEDNRAADVLDNMQAEDAADLIAQLPEAEGEHLLTLMEPEEAEDVRTLLNYESDTAGGLMSPEPIIVSAETTVAEGMALIRKHELAPAMAAAVCVTLPPYETPTGKFLGVVHFQKMLRHPPHERLGSIVDDSIHISVKASAAEVAIMLATYNLVSLPVVDESMNLVGLITVDDVLDHLLPDDWRSHDDDKK